MKKYFRHFVRVHWKGIQISNEELDLLCIEFEKYLYAKVGEEKARSWFPKSLADVIMNATHPFKAHGYEPALVIHFCNFIDDGVKEIERVSKPSLPKDKNGKLLKIGDKVHPLGRGDRVLYVVELGDKTAGVSSDQNAQSGNGVLYEKLIKFKNQD